MSQADHFKYTMSIVIFISFLYLGASVGLLDFPYTELILSLSFIFLLDFN